jgi:hypothetical protein
VDVTDDDLAGLTMQITAASISENGGTTTATVSRNSSTNSPLTVTLTSSDPGELTVPATVTIAAGQTTSAPFDISSVDDAIVDGTQTVSLTATATAHAASADTLDITDNDTAVADLSVTQHGNEEGHLNIVYTVTLSRTNHTGEAITFNLDDLFTGTATSGDDYTAIAANAFVSVAAGANSGTLTVPITDDALLEGTETVIARISGSSNPAVTIGTDSAVAGITDNDTAVADLSVTAHGREAGRVAIVYTVTLSTPNHTGSAITFDLVDLHTGTATSGIDYSAIDALAFISVAAGDNSGTYTVAVADDFLPEAAETVVAQITYSSDANVTIGTDSATASIADNDAGRTPGNVTAVVSGSNLTVTGDAGDNGISVSTNTAGDIVVTGVGGTTVNGAAEFTTFAAVASTLPGNLTVNGLGGRDLISVSDVTVTGRTLLYGGDDLDAIEVINTNVNGNLLVMEQAGDGFIDLSGGIFAGVVQLLTGEGDNQVTVANADFRNVLQLTAGTGNDQITLHAVSVTSSTQINSGSGNDSIQLNDTNHLSTLYITADAGNDTITGQGVAVTATTYMNTGSGNDTVDFDGLHAKSVAILILGADHDAARFLNSRFDNVVNMPVTAGNNVMDLQNTTFNGPTYVQTSGGALAARIRNNTFNSNVFITGGPGNTDILLDDLTSTFAVTRGVSGFEDLTNTFINESFQTLPELAFS